MRRLTEATSVPLSRPRASVDSDSFTVSLRGGARRGASDANAPASTRARATADAIGRVRGSDPDDRPTNG